MHRNSAQSGYIQLILIIILIIGIVVGIYLVKNPQILKSLASSSVMNLTAVSGSLQGDYPNFIATPNTELEIKITAPSGSLTTVNPLFGTGDDLSGGISKDEAFAIGVKSIFSWGPYFKQELINAGYETNIMFSTTDADWENTEGIGGDNNCTETSCPFVEEQVRTFKQANIQKGNPRYIQIANEANTNFQDTHNDLHGGKPPRDFAIRYYKISQAIKRIDLEAKIVGPAWLGWSQFTAVDLAKVPDFYTQNAIWAQNGRQYATEFIQEYQQLYNTLPPIDVLNIHLYPGNDDWARDSNRKRTHHKADIEAMIQELEDYRSWADRNGYQDKPIWITEFGLVHCAGEDTQCISDENPIVKEEVNKLLTTLVPYFHGNRSRLNLQKWFVFVSSAKRDYPVIFPLKLFYDFSTDLSSGHVARKLTDYGVLYKQLSAQYLPNLDLMTGLGRHNSSTLATSNPTNQNFHVYSGIVNIQNPGATTFDPATHGKSLTDPSWFSESGDYWHSGPEENWMMLTDKTSVAENLSALGVYWKAPQPGTAIITVTERKLEQGGDGYTFGLGKTSSLGHSFQGRSIYKQVDPNDIGVNTITYTNQLNADEYLLYVKSAYGSKGPGSALADAADYSLNIFFIPEGFQVPKTDNKIAFYTLEKPSYNLISTQLLPYNTGFQPYTGDNMTVLKEVLKPTTTPPYLYKVKFWDIYGQQIGQEHRSIVSLSQSNSQISPSPTSSGISESPRSPQETPIATPTSDIPQRPPSPTNFTHKCGPESTGIALSWDSVPGATKYYLRVDDLDNGEGADHLDDDVTQTEQVVGIRPGGRYKAWVHTVNNANTHSDPPAVIDNIVCNAPAATFTGYTISEDISVRNASTSPQVQTSSATNVDFQLSDGSGNKTIFVRLFYSNGRYIDRQQTIIYNQSIDTSDSNPISFSSDFSSPESEGSITPEWSITRGTFGIKNNQAYISSSCPAPGYAIRDGSLNGVTQVSLPQNKQDARIVFRYIDLNNYYLVEAKGDGYSLDKIINGVLTNLGISNSPVDNGDVLKVETFGSSIQIFLNNTRIIEANDNSVNGTKVGFGTWCDTSMRFDDFSYTAM